MIIIKDPAKIVFVNWYCWEKIFLLIKFKYCIINHWIESWKKGLDLLQRRTMVSAYVDQQKCSCNTGIKWVRFPSKNKGKNHEVLLRKPKQICINLHGNNWKIFVLASWKRSELAGKKKKLVCKYYTV